MINGKSLDCYLCVAQHWTKDTRQARKGTGYRRHDQQRPHQREHITREGEEFEGCFGTWAAILKPEED